jgi:parallel beta-helix repeat protein
LDPKKVVSCIILFGLVVCFIQSPYVPLKGSTSSSMSVTSGDYTPADRLSISYNDELIAAGYPGSGTQEDPYVIEGFEFPSVYFYRVDLHVVIQNCKFSYGNFYYTNNTRIENCEVESQLYFGYSRDNIISSNSISSGLVRLQSSTNFNLTDNVLGLQGVFIDGGNPMYWHHSFSNNTAAGNALVYMRDQRDLHLDPEDYGMLILANCTNCTISDGIALEQGRFIRAGFCYNSTFARNDNCHFNAVNCAHLEFSDNTASTTHASGIDLMMCTNVIVVNNTFTENERDGIALQRSSECTVVNNTVSGYTGLHLSGQDIGYGACEESGINAYQSTSCLILNNTLCGNPRAGIWYCYSNGFSILNNTIFENTLAGVDGYGDEATFSYNVIHDNSGPGLTLTSADFFNVTYNILYDNNGGIAFDTLEASNNNISYNWISDDGTCIHVNDVGNSSITNNTVYGGGFVLSSLAYINFSGNTLNDKEVGYCWGLNSTDFGLYGYAQAFIYNCMNVTVYDGYFEGCVKGLSISRSNFTVITNITAIDCVEEGIQVSNSHYSQVTNCTMINNEYGIVADYSNDLLIANTTIEGAKSGVVVSYLHNIAIANCSFSDTVNGIYMARGQNCTIIGNDFYGCSIQLTGGRYDFNHTIEENSVNGRPLGYFEGLTDRVVDTEGYGAIIVALCTDVAFEGGDYSNATIGVGLYSSVNCTISGITSQSNTRSGIQVASCWNCRLKNCTFMDNPVYGIEIGNTWSATRYTEIIDCVVKRNELGIRVTYDRNTTIVNTTVSYSKDVGVLLYYADWFTLENCSVTDNGDTGVSGSLGFGLSNVIGNVVSRNGRHGVFDVGSGSVVSSNIIADNAEDGITHSGSVLITQNQILCNGGSGLASQYASHSNITWNSIIGNHLYGIEFDYEYHQNYNHDNLIFGNSLGGNVLGNALDNGEDNRWDDGFIGNAWQDWTGVGVYNVPGLAGSVDNHPWVFGGEPPVRPLPEPTKTVPTTTTPTSPTTATGPSPGEGWFEVVGLLTISGLSAFIGVVVTLIVVKRKTIPIKE